ncbi:hypothetical protein D3C75_945080 [compost metagenome]
MIPVTGEEGLRIKGVAGPDLQLAGIDEFRQGLNHAGILVLVEAPQRSREDQHRFAGMAVHFVFHVSMKVPAVFFVVAYPHPSTHPIPLLVEYSSRCP